MKNLRKYAHIVEVIAFFGVIILAVLMQTEWLHIDTVTEKVLAAVFAIVVSGGAGYYWWVQYRKENSKP